MSKDCGSFYLIEGSFRGDFEIIAQRKTERELEMIACDELHKRRPPVQFMIYKAIKSIGSGRMP